MRVCYLGSQGEKVFQGGGSGGYLWNTHSFEKLWILNISSSAPPSCTIVLVSFYRLKN